MATLVSPSATIEEMYLTQKLMRALGSNNIDHRLHQLDFSDQDIAPLFPSLGQPLAELENNDAVLLVGSWIRKDQPIAAHRIRKAALKGAKIMTVNPVDYDFNFPVEESLISSPAKMVNSLAGITKALLGLTGLSAPQGLESLLNNITANDAHLDIAKHLHSGENSSVLIGTQAMLQPQLADIRSLCNVISELSSSKLGYLSLGANAAGAWLSGVLPHRQCAGMATENSGKNTSQMLSDNMKAFVLLNVEPELDSNNPAAAIKAVNDADFVISLSPFVSDEMKAYADVLLPVSPFSETSGTFVNVEGHWQSFTAAVKPYAEARPAWKVLRVFGNIFNVDGFDYLSSEEVRDEVKQQVAVIEKEQSNKSEWRCPKELAKASDNINRIGLLPIYAIDSIVRRSKALQKTSDVLKAVVYLNETLAQQNQIEDEDDIVVTQDNVKLKLRVRLDESVPDNCVVIPQGVYGVESFNTAYAEVKLNNKA